MSKAKPSVASKSSGVVKSEQASAQSKGTFPRGRIDMQMVQNILLIWLDNNIDDHSTDYSNTIIQLRCVINSINTFTDADQCIDFLTNIYSENVCMLISGALCQNLVPLIHDIAQLGSIFIFCENKTGHEQWAKSWSKIKGVFTEMSSISEALKQVAQQCEQNTIPISLIATSDDTSTKKLDQLEPTFMYTQILKEILLTIKFEQQHMIGLIDYCCEQLAGNDRELRNIKKFQQKYHDETPIWWYTFECFLYPMLNRALRLMDMDIIIKMGFFIGDLHRHIEQLHKKQFAGQSSNKSFTVYRGQGVSKADFEELTKTKGGLISFNNFLSTSKNLDVSSSFARRALPNPDMVGILFVMVIDPSKSTAPFASITDVSYYKDKEDEVLFAMHTVFRIGDIMPMGENHRLFQVELTLTSDNDKDLRRLTDYIREASFPDHEGWYRLGTVLLKMDQSEKAQQVYQILLEQATEEREKAAIYNQLGLIKGSLGEYQEAITLYEKSVEIGEKTRPRNLLNLASFYNNIGEACRNTGEYSKALSSHEKALEIRQQSLPSNHPNLASSYNNIGNVYYSMGDCSKALSYYEKALEIDKKTLPPNHPDLASSYNNIGSMYGQMGKYAKALPYFEKTLAMQQQSLPPNHPGLAKTYGNIGVVYEIMNNHLKTRSFYETAVEIGQRSLPPNHPELQMWKKNLDRVKKKL